MHDCDYYNIAIPDHKIPEYIVYSWSYIQFTVGAYEKITVESQKLAGSIATQLPALHVHPNYSGFYKNIAKIFGITNWMLTAIERL